MGEEYFLRHIALLLHILALCLDVVDLALSWGYYVGNVLVLPQRSLAGYVNLVFL